MACPVLLPVLGVVAAVYTASLAFVGTPQQQLRTSRVPCRVSAEYLERCGPKDSDVPFDPAQASDLEPQLSSRSDLSVSCAGCHGNGDHPQVKIS